MKLVPTNNKVQIKWFVWSAGQKLPRTSSMRGTWGFDATCSCGWETKSGGGVYSWIKSEVELHKVREHGYTYNFGKVGA